MKGIGSCWRCLTASEKPETNRATEITMREARRPKRLAEHGDAQLAAGNIDTAVTLYGQATMLDFTCAEALYGLALVSWRRGDPATACGLAWGILAWNRHRNHVPATKLLSWAHFAQGQREDAWYFLKNPVHMGDQSARLQMTSVYCAQWGVVNEEEGSYGRAELYLRDALRYDWRYATRYAMVSIYRFDPFLADVHHRRCGARGNLWGDRAAHVRHR